MIHDSPELREEIKNLVKEYFAEECEVDIEGINDNTHVIDDLDGDSLMFLSLLEIVKKKYNVKVEIRTVGKKLIEKKVETVSETIDMVLLFLDTAEELSK
ncbi:MAG: acyl carrier protein [Candidatus Brocadiaceae bacterium]|nr:acyl carrier protein [Candidatus Brocadiaceae bacterium]